MLTIAMFAGLLMPPERFDHEPLVPYRVTYAAPVIVNGVCSRPAHRVVGCTWGGSIFIDKTLTEQDRANVLRHEKAHINGWHHPGE